MAGAESPELSKGAPSRFAQKPQNPPLYPPLSSAVLESYHMAGAENDQTSRMVFFENAACRRGKGSEDPEIRRVNQQASKPTQRPLSCIPAPRSARPKARGYKVISRVANLATADLP